MELEIFKDEDSCTWVITWESKGIYIRFPNQADAHLFAREMISTYSGVTI